MGRRSLFYHALGLIWGKTIFVKNKQAVSFIKLIRVNNWVKNLFVFFPLLFSANLTSTTSLVNSALAFLAFCFTSSFVYIINDIKDKDQDKLHPSKQKRPIAAGNISIPTALTVGVVMIVAGFSIMASLSINLIYLLLFYVLMNIAYTFYLKHISIIDCICVAIGFVLRIQVGSLAIGVVASDWILTVTFFLALYLAFSKRKSELLLLDKASGSHRKSLDGYSLKLLDVYIFICATISLAAYLLYSFDQRVIATFHNDYLKYSVVFVVIGFFRYFQIIETKVYDGEGDPTTLVLKDKPLQMAVLAWVLYIVWVIYG
jgi:decaprenyl-phosphate phosphoribosyltransferase